MTTITVSGTPAFIAYRCPVCGMRTSDPADIARCEEKHAEKLEWIKGTSNKTYDGKPRRVTRQKVNFTCHSPGCDKPAQARGYCGQHYMRMW